MDDIVDKIHRGNENISREFIINRLVYELIGKAIWFPRDYPDFQSVAENEVLQLLHYSPEREIDVPLVHIDVGSEPFIFGCVTFYPMTQSDREDSWLTTLHVADDTFLAHSVLSYARVVGRGDLTVAKEEARRIVSETLIFLRAIGFPISIQPQVQFGMLDEYAYSQISPYRSKPPKEKIKLEAAIKTSWKVGPPLRAYNIRTDLLSAIDDQTYRQFDKLIANNYHNPGTEIIRKFLLGLRWLGEATKPDIIEMRFTKLAFALEAFIGGESNQDILTTRGLTATLSERGAFLVGKDEKERIDVHAAIHKYYKFRSSIVHGSTKQIREAEFIDFASLVRRIGWALFHKIEIFKNIDDLQRWVLSQRYQNKHL
ncbi:MAG: hypothetical protein ABIJ39_03610 [Chloroflexota bacterium]